MTLVQSTPTVIYELQLDAFRLTLKDLEDDLEGMPWTKTHNHNTEVTLGGLTFARVIEILPPYSVTFEDDQYAVNLVGANSNVGDVVNVNQVSVRSENSAGLISSPAIEFSSFEGVVAVDTLSIYSGTGYPIGTKRQPVNNLADALLIASFRGITSILSIGDLTIGGSAVIDALTVIGEGPGKSNISVTSGASTVGTIFNDCDLSGTLFGPKAFRNVHFGTLTIDGPGTGEEIIMNRCGFQSTVTMDPIVDGSLSIIDCFSLVPGTLSPIIDFGGGDTGTSIRRYTGGIDIRNFSNVAGPVMSIDMTSGNIIIDSTCTTGVIVIRGVSKLADNSTGTTVDTTGLVYAEQLQLASFNERIHLDPVGGSAGTKFPIGTEQTPAKTLADAQTIAMTRGITTIHLYGTLVLLPSDNVDGFTIEGDNALNAIVAALAGCSTEETRFTDLIITGTIDGGVYCEKVGLSNLLGIGSDSGPSLFLECTLLEGTCALRNGLSTPKNIQFADCTAGVSTGTGLTFDFNGGASNVAFRKFGGDITIAGDTAGLTRALDVDQGHITVAASCTTGTLNISGNAGITDNSTGTYTVAYSPGEGDFIATDRSALNKIWSITKALLGLS
jgi:hypothetical protein